MENVFFCVSILPSELFFSFHHLAECLIFFCFLTSTNEFFYTVQYKEKFLTILFLD
jgi:hypothetical protein